jgi:hypothetical protein
MGVTDVPDFSMPSWIEASLFCYIEHAAREMKEEISTKRKKHCNFISSIRGYDKLLMLSNHPAANKPLVAGR